MKLYSMYNNCEQKYNKIFEARNDKIAIRIAQDLFSKNQYIRAEAKDWELYRVGEWNDENGMINPSYEKICNISDEQLFKYEEKVSKGDEENVKFWKEQYEKEFNKPWYKKIMKKGAKIERTPKNKE